MHTIQHEELVVSTLSDHCNLVKPEFPQGQQSGLRPENISQKKLDPAEALLQVDVGTDRVMHY